MADTTDFPIPPASFPFLVESILMQAQMQLGLLSFGGADDTEDKPEPNLALARHSIDLLAMLQDKTRGNLSVEEQRLVENGLTELRFRYIQIADDVKRKSEPVSASKEKEDDRPLIITADGGKGSKTD